MIGRLQRYIRIDYGIVAFKNENSEFKKGYGSLLLPLFLVKLILRHFKYVNDPLETNVAKKGKDHQIKAFKWLIQTVPGFWWLLHINDFRKVINFFYFGKSSANQEIIKDSDSEEVQDSPNMILFKKAMNLILGNAATNRNIYIDWAIQHRLWSSFSKISSGHFSKHDTAVAGLWGTLISAGLLQEKIFKKPYLLDNSTSIFFNSSIVSSNLTSGANETSEFSDFEHYKDSQFIIFFNRFFSALLAGFFLLFQAEFKSRYDFS